MPNLRASGAFCQFPVIPEEKVKIAHIPLCGIRRPGTFNAAGCGVNAQAAFEIILPTEALLNNARAFRLCAHQLGIAGAMGFTKSMSTGHKRHGLFIIHGHAREGFADVIARGDGIRVAIRAFWVHVDQAHLHGRQRVFQLALATVAVVVKPALFGAPIDIFFGFPNIDATASEAKGFEAHRFKRNIAGQNHQIGPGQSLAVFLFDGPKQAAGLVEVAVVRPAVERCKTLLTRTCAAAPISGAIGASAVPGHTNEEGTVMPVICGPPVLAVGHQRG